MPSPDRLAFSLTVDFPVFLPRFTFPKKEEAALRSCSFSGRSLGGENGKQEGGKEKKGAEKCTSKWKRPRIRLVGSFFYLRSTVPHMEQKTKWHQVDHPTPEEGGELESFASVLRPLPFS